MNYAFLKSLTKAELIELKEAVVKEIGDHQELQSVKYEHDCFVERRSKFHFQKCKHWSKLIENIDTSKTNGYAFIGTFLPTQKQDIVPINSLVVERCDMNLKCYRMTSQGKKLIVTGSTKSMVDFIALVKQEL